ncbi:MAG: hypothetical protein WCC57_05730 [Paracoccaceae bacterium]
MFVRPIVAAFALFCAVSSVPLQVWADNGAQVTDFEISTDVSALTKTLQIAEMMQVMREEGIDYGSTLEAEMFPGKGGAKWLAVVGLIYDPAVMQKRFEAAFDVELKGDPATIAVMQAFFGSERGQRILTMETEARRALMDEKAKEAAKVVVEEMTAKQDPRMAALQAFAHANDLTEQNVAGALNANLAFYKGLAAGGAFGDDMTEDQMLADVWSQEPDIRLETEDWLFSYLTVAYASLSDDDLAAYQAVSETPEGQKLNAAMFAAFDAVFTQISYDLGRAAAKQMQGEDI